MNSKLFFLALILFSGNLLFAQDAITLSVTNLHNNKGHVLISLFRNCEGFPDKPEKAYRKVQLPINNKSASFVFVGLPAGNYSVAILHDENDDSRMNTNFFGIPKEGYGFSNNVMGTFGPPSCTRASFRHPGNKASQLIIRSRYAK